ncbi:uroporphyrinogen III methyltransferase [Caldovatus sediminis]|uniref:Uroporphyrinogen-III synthase n=1 Tax=Caldovatus sediminis TaxID=2041189 RepID=A0A8J3EDZ0_9PROT|nr:uroporphyrinogen-III synthase [Caldovatus sediminis]GGG47737.1 uroporphyrinogen III methyltransferase [Caldovatus sediminis]
MTALPPPAPDAVLVTRPEPGAEETAARVAALGWRPVLAPALVLAPRPRGVARALSGRPAQALILTSRAAARALTPFPAAPPVFAVGAATAAEAHARGFTVAAAAEGTAVSLAALVARRLDPAAGPLLLAVGEGYGEELAGALRGQGFRVLRRVVYAAAPARTLPEPARAALGAGEVAVALFFSPRSVGAAMVLLRRAGLSTAVARMEALAISTRVAEALDATAPPGGWRRVRVAARPDQDSLLALLGPRPGRAATAEQACDSEDAEWVDEAPRRGAGSAGVA